VLQALQSEVLRKGLHWPKHLEGNIQLSARMLRFGFHEWECSAIRIISRCPGRAHRICPFVEGPDWGGRKPSGHPF
jgi:hypothetical protein